MRVSNALIVDLAQDGQFIMMVGLALIRLTYVREIVMMAGHHETRLSSEITLTTVEVDTCELFWVSLACC